MFAIECHQVTKRFVEGHFWSRQRKEILAVDDLSFQVRKGEIFGLLGTNGSGKSTLIRMLSTLLYPDEGQIRIMGLDPVREPMAVRRLINRVAVDAAFFKKLSARENLDYATRLYGQAPVTQRARLQGILERLGLGADKLDESIEDMSRGMQQKVAIARAMISVPPVLLLVSGIYYPVSALPHWLQGFSVLSPATFALEGVRAALLQGATVAELLPVMLRLLLMAAVLIPLGLLVFHLGEQHAKRSGLLKRNG